MKLLKEYIKKLIKESSNETTLASLKVALKDGLVNKNIEGRFLTPKQAEALQDEIESNYIDGDMTKHFKREKDDIRMNLHNYDHPIAEKDVNGVNLRIVEGLVRNKRKTYLLYADGKLIGEFYSVKDIKDIIKYIESKLVSNKKSLKEEKIPKPNKSFLYHGTNIKNLNDIQKYGLIPDFGDTVKGTEGYEYYMDDDYINPEDRVDGVIFFSDNPDTWSYSHFGGTPNIDEAVLVIVKKNETIFRKVGDYIYDMSGSKVNSVNYISIDKLPFFIENGDYFTFEEQTPHDILYGERLKQFLKQ